MGNDTRKKVLDKIEKLLENIDEKSEDCQGLREKTQAVTNLSIAFQNLINA